MLQYMSLIMIHHPTPNPEHSRSQVKDLQLGRSSQAWMFRGKARGTRLKWFKVECAPRTQKREKEGVKGCWAWDYIMLFNNWVAQFITLTMIANYKQIATNGIVYKGITGHFKGSALCISLGLYLGLGIEWENISALLGHTVCLTTYAFKFMKA